MSEIDLVSLAKRALEQGSSISDDDSLTDDDRNELLQETSSEDTGSVQEETDEGKPAKQAALRDFLKNRFQYDLGEDLSDEDLYPQIGQLIEERQKMAEELDAYRNQGRQQPPPRQEAIREAHKEAVKEEKKGWKVLEYDAEWERAADFDPETRQWVAKQKYGTWGNDAANNLNEYFRQQTERARRLTNDPMAVLREAGLDDYLEQYKQELARQVAQVRNEISNEWRSTYTQTKTNEELEGYFQKNRDQYFRLDAQGNYLKDLKGQVLMTPKGEAYRAAAVEARNELGMQDPNQIHRYASRLSEATVPAAPVTPVAAAPPPAPEKSAKERNKEQKKKFLDKGHSPANRLTNRDGSVQSAKENGEAQNKSLSFSDMVLSDPDNAELLGRYFKG